MVRDGKYILCIEPIHDFGILLGTMLHRSDLPVKFAETIEDPGLHLRTRPPTIVVIENAFTPSELEQWVTFLKKRAPVSKLLMVSSFDDNSSAIAFSAGIDRFLVRPFNKATLVNAVLSMLS